MDYRGTAIAGLRIGVAGIIAGLSYFGEYASAAIPMIIVAFILTNIIMRQNPSEALEEGLKKNLEGVVDRVSDLEGKVDEIVRLLEGWRIQYSSSKGRMAVEPLFHLN